MAIRTAVIPAAGIGTRFLPVSKSVPKEMLPLVDYPAIQHCVEQAVQCGIERIVLVTSRGKKAIEDYFSVAPELERILGERNNPKLEQVARVSRLAEIVPVMQHEQLGLGHAVLCARDAVANEPFMVYLPDEILIGQPSATEQVLTVFESLQGSVIGVMEQPTEELERYGVAAGANVSSRTMQLSHVVEKPKPGTAPSNLAIFGPYAFTPSIFESLASLSPGALGEIQLSDAIDALAANEPVFAHSLDVHRFDAGTPIGLLQASVELALARPEYSAQMRAWINNLASRLTQLRTTDGSSS